MKIGTDRPYPITGLTSELWADVPLQYVVFDDLTTTQDGVLLHVLLDCERTPFSGDTFPHVVAHDGSLYLEDGHTRVVRDALRGYAGSWMRVFVSAAAAVPG